MSFEEESTALDFLALATGENDRRRFTLLVYLGRSVQAVPLDADGSLVVGRGQQADISLPDGALSRRHVRFAVEGGAVLVEDLGSTNGTSIDGERIDASSSLKIGQTVCAGAVTIMLHDPDAGRSAIRQVPTGGQDSGIITDDPRVLAIQSDIARVAASKLPVLIVGETGTGKELFAREVHRKSDRADQPLRAINCGALPEQLVESLLFGHERGAFTGADRSSRGVFEDASGGTVFLDEIAELRLEAQVALLRVLETQRITRVGAHDEIRVDVRVVAATNRDLGSMCEQGVFRRDLFFRLQGFEVCLPPLRERKRDIDALVAHFVAEAAARADRPAPEVTADCLGALHAYPWPGNVRELRHVVESAVLLARDDKLTRQDLPERLRSTSTSAPATPARSRADTLVMGVVAPRRSSDEQRGLDLRQEIRAYEHALIHAALLRASGNQTDAAQLLQMPRRTLVHKLGELRDIEMADDELPPIGDLEIGVTFKELVQRFEKRILVDALAHSDDLATAARRLSLSETALARRVRKYGLR